MNILNQSVYAMKTRVQCYKNVNKFCTVQRLNKTY